MPQSKKDSIVKGMGKRPTYDPSKSEHTVDIRKEVYEGLREKYPWANMKALINAILAERLDDNNSRSK